MRRSQRMRSGQPLVMRCFTPSSPFAATVTWAPRAVSMSRASSRWSRSSSTTSTEAPLSGIGEPLWPEGDLEFLGAGREMLPIVRHHEVAHDDIWTSNARGLHAPSGRGEAKSSERYVRWRTDIRRPPLRGRVILAAMPEDFLANRLLAVLDPEERHSLLRGAKSEPIDAHQVLYAAGREISHVYFPISGVV